MADADDFIKSYALYHQSLKTANALNKNTVFDALAVAGVDRVTASFDGEGDSGQIEDVIAYKGNEPTELPGGSVTIHSAGFGSEANTTEAVSLSYAIEKLCYGYLEQYQGGWENNDGAFGSFAFDVSQRTIELEFNGRFTDVATHNYDL